MGRKRGVGVNGKVFAIGFAVFLVLVSGFALYTNLR